MSHIDEKALQSNAIAALKANQNDQKTGRGKNEKIPKEEKIKEEKILISRIENPNSLKEKVGENPSVNNPKINPISLKSIDTQEGAGNGMNVSAAIANSNGAKIIKNQK